MRVRGNVVEDSDAGATAQTGTCPPFLHQATASHVYGDTSKKAELPAAAWLCKKNFLDWTAVWGLDQYDLVSC